MFFWGCDVFFFLGGRGEKRALHGGWLRMAQSMKPYHPSMMTSRAQGILIQHHQPNRGIQTFLVPGQFGKLYKKTAASSWEGYLHLSPNSMMPSDRKLSPCYYTSACTRGFQPFTVTTNIKRSIIPSSRIECRILKLVFVEHTER